MGVTDVKKGPTAKFTVSKRLDVEPLKPYITPDLPFKSEIARWNELVRERERRRREEHAKRVEQENNPVVVYVRGLGNKTWWMFKQKERKHIPDDVKMFVWRRDEGKCVKCDSRENIEFDHIIPVSKGGSNTARNIQILCEKCNREKGDSIT